MSEIGKYFDSILDYKLRQENAIYKKPDTPRVISLPPSTIPDYYKSVTWKDFIEGFTERKPNSPISPDPIAALGLNFDVEVKKYGGGVETLAEESIKFLEKVKEKQGLYDFEVCCDSPLEYKWEIDPSPIDIIIPVQHIQLSCVIKRDGVTFTELCNELVKEESSDDEYFSGVIQEEYEEQSMDARVAENGMTIDFKEDDSPSVYKALKHWIDFVNEPVNK